MIVAIKPALEWDLEQTPTFLWALITVSGSSDRPAMRDEGSYKRVSIWVKWQASNVWWRLIQAGQYLGQVTGQQCVMKAHTSGSVSGSSDRPAMCDEGSYKRVSIWVKWQASNVWWRLIQAGQYLGQVTGHQCVMKAHTNGSVSGSSDRPPMCDEGSYKRVSIWVKWQASNVWWRLIQAGQYLGQVTGHQCVMKAHTNGSVSGSSDRPPMCDEGSYKRVSIWVKWQASNAWWRLVERLETSTFVLKCRSKVCLIFTIKINMAAIFDCLYGYCRTVGA